MQHDVARRLRLLDPENPEIDATWPALAFACALFKFALVGAGLLTLAVGTLRAPKN